MGFCEQSYYHWQRKFRQETYSLVKESTAVVPIKPVTTDPTPHYVYNGDVYEKQKELMIYTYGAIRAIRILFMKHPLTKGIEVPDYLLDGNNIVFY